MIRDPFSENSKSVASPTSDDLLLCLEQEKQELMRLKKNLETYKLRRNRNRQKRIVDGQEWDETITRIKRISQNSLNSKSLSNSSSSSSSSNGTSFTSGEETYLESSMEHVFASSESLKTTTGLALVNSDDSVEDDAYLNYQEANLVQKGIEDKKENWYQDWQQVMNDDDDSDLGSEPSLRYITIPEQNKTREKRNMTDITQPETPSPPLSRSPSLEEEPRQEPCLPMLRTRNRQDLYDFQMRSSIAVDHTKADSLISDHGLNSRKKNREEGFWGGSPQEPKSLPTSPAMDNDRYINYKSSFESREYFQRPGSRLGFNSQSGSNSNYAEEYEQSMNSYESDNDQVVYEDCRSSFDSEMGQWSSEYLNEAQMQDKLVQRIIRNQIQNNQQFASQILAQEMESYENYAEEYASSDPESNRISMDTITPAMVKSGSDIYKTPSPDKSDMPALTIRLAQRIASSSSRSLFGSSRVKLDDRTFKESVSKGSLKINTSVEKLASPTSPSSISPTSYSPSRNSKNTELRQKLDLYTPSSIFGKYPKMLVNNDLQQLSNSKLSQVSQETFQQRANTNPFAFAVKVASPQANHDSDFKEKSETNAYKYRGKKGPRKTIFDDLFVDIPEPDELEESEILNSPPLTNTGPTSPPQYDNLMAAIMKSGSPVVLQSHSQMDSLRHTPKTNTKWSKSPDVYSPLNPFQPSPQIKTSQTNINSTSSPSHSSLHKEMFQNAFPTQDKPPASYHSGEGANKRISYLPPVDKTGLLNEMLSIFDQTSQALDGTGNEVSPGGSLSSSSGCSVELTHENPTEKLAMIKGNPKALGASSKLSMSSSLEYSKESSRLKPSNSELNLQSPNLDPLPISLTRFGSKSVSHLPDVSSKPLKSILMKPSEYKPATQNVRFDLGEGPIPVEDPYGKDKMWNITDYQYNGYPNNFNNLPQEGCHYTDTNSSRVKDWNTAAIGDISLVTRFDEPLKGALFPLQRSKSQTGKYKQPFLQRLKTMVNNKGSRNAYGSLPRLYRFDDLKVDRLIATGQEISARLLDTRNAYILESSTEKVFLWHGSHCTDPQQREASQFAGALLETINKRVGPGHSLKLEFEGSESDAFVCEFPDWNDQPHLSPRERPLYERDAFIKLREIYSQQPQPLMRPLDDKVKIEVKMWLIRNERDQIEIEEEEHGIFHSGETYLIMYHYRDTKKVERHVVFYWIGRHSKRAKEPLSEPSVVALDDRTEALMVQVLQGREPEPFFKVFNGMVIVRKGSRKSSRTSWEKSLYHVRGFKPDMVRVEQTGFSSRYLCSGHSFVLVVKGHTFVWHGIGSFLCERLTAVQAAKKLSSPTNSIVEVRENLEPRKFWSKLGEYPNYANASQWARKPFLLDRYRVRLFELSIEPDRTVKMEEIQSFHQCDLDHSKVYLLDTYFDLFIRSKSEVDANGQLELVTHLNLSMEYAKLVNEREHRPFQLKPIMIWPDHEPLEFIAQFPAWNEVS
jgi:hypothetical protein